MQSCILALTDDEEEGGGDVAAAEEVKKHPCLCLHVSVIHICLTAGCMSLLQCQCQDGLQEV